MELEKIAQYERAQKDSNNVDHLAQWRAQDFNQ